MEVPHALEISNDADGLGAAAMVVLLACVVHTLHYHDVYLYFIAFGLFAYLAEGFSLRL